MRGSLVCLLVAVLAGCASSRGPDGPRPGEVTLCIENAAVGYGNLVAYAGSARFNVYAGEEVCKNVMAAGPGLSVRAASTGGGAAGPLRFQFQLPSLANCWYWRVSTANVLDLTPCEEEELEGGTYP